MSRVKTSHRKSNTVKLIARVVALGLALSMTVVALSPKIEAEAVYDTDSAISFKDYRAAHAVPDKMLFIGTYLIHKDALTDAVYEKALTSQTEFNQFIMYYKSELGEGGSAWYDISSAEGLGSITKDGTIIDEFNMKDYWVTYVVNEDGTVTNAKTGASSCIFDTPDPYDLANLPEFKALKGQYDALFSEKSKGVDLYYYQSLKEFWATELKDNETNELDTQIRNLNTAYTEMKAKGADTEANLIMDLMTQLDNKRRSIVYRKLVLDENMVMSTGKTLDEIRAQYENSDEDLAQMDEEERNKILKVREELEAEADVDANNYKGNNPTSILQAKLTGTGYDSWTNDNKQFTYEEVYEYLKDRIDDDTDMNEWSDQVEDINSNSKYVGGTLDKETFKINDSVVDILNTAINDCKTSYTNYTKNLLEDDESVLGHAMYEQKLALVNIAKSSSSGMDANLRNLALLNCIRDNTIKDGDAELELLESDLLPKANSNFNSAVTSGTDTHYSTVAAQNGSNYAYETAINQQDAETSKHRSELETLIEAKELRVTTKQAFAYINNCLVENENLKNQVVADAYQAEANNQILNHKLWLEDEIQKLKNRDDSLLSEAEKLAEQKDDLLDKKQGALDDGDRNKAAKYDAELGKIDDAINKANADAGGAGTAADSAIDDLKDKALSDIANGGDGKEGLDALAAMGATDAIDDVAEEAGVPNSDAVKAAKEASEANNKAGIGNDLNGGGNQNLTKGDIENALEDFFGKSFGELSDEEKIIAAVATSWYASQGNKAASLLCKNWIESCASNKNKYVYDTLNDPRNEYASLNAIGRVTDYRYVHAGTNLNGTLEGKNGSYSFSAGSSDVTQAKGSVSKMAASAKMYENSALYIPETFVQGQFNLNVEEVNNSDYSALLTGNMTKRATEFLEILQGAD